jgi:tetratricopeptide (TPR) repeat protein
MDRRWAFAGISILMIILIYNFLTTIFKSDQKRFSHDRIFVDYSEYRSKPGKTSRTTASYQHPNAYKAAREASEIKKTMFQNVMTATISSYNDYMNKSLKEMPSPTADYPKPLNNPQYNQVIELAAKAVPGYQSGLHYFASGDYEKAIVKFNEALQEVDQMDVKHRIDIFSMLAECYLKQRNDDGYIQNKIRQVRMERRLKKIIADAFPEKRDTMTIFDWATTQEASKQLLRMRSLAARSDAPQMQEMLKRSELDLEVARKVTQ